MLKIGFELEAFCLDKDKKPCLVPSGHNLPFDECGWLVEVRSEPHSDVRKAVALFRAEIEKVEALAKEASISLSYVPLMKIPRELKVEAARKHQKGLIQFKNIYGHQTHKNPTTQQTASVHISFTNQFEFKYTTGKPCKKCGVAPSSTFPYQGFIDHAKLIVGLDTAFKDEIAKAKRNPGFYEVKYDGRIEYRSLPNNVDLSKVADTLLKLI